MIHRLALSLAAVLLAACSPCLAQRAAEPDVELPAGINDRFLDPELNANEFVERFERDGREPYMARQAIVEALAIKPGMRVADIGAGTGLFTVLFSEQVGRQGWVYAVDISPRFVEHIASRAQEAGLKNITAVLCDQDSINLPPGSIDLAFVCDTYHHFEYPTDTVESIYQALRPGGRLVLLDFKRDEATSSEWILGHVRAGQDVFAQEICSEGFQLAAEPEVEGLHENYLLIFRKPDAAE